MFWLDIPTLGKVRKATTEADKEARFVCRYTDNEGIEGYDETRTLVVTLTVVDFGPDCDGTRKVNAVYRVQFEGGSGTAYCHTGADNRQWRDLVAYLYGQDCGYWAGKVAGANDERDRWVSILREAGR